MKNLGFIGWRGMVGSVLLNRMVEEKDLDKVKTILFSQSAQGKDAPSLPNVHDKILNANNIDELSTCDIIICCQGGDYTTSIYPQLQSKGWNGFWIDASSAFRMDSDAIIVLDPVNHSLIVDGIKKGTKKYIGGNCTVSLMVLALHGLLKENLVDRISVASYQSVSGGGAPFVREMLKQMQYICTEMGDLLQNDHSPILDIDKKLIATQRSSDFPTEHFGIPIAGNLIPWIDKDLGDGMSREEKKGLSETNKILGLSEENKIQVESVCVRVGTTRCHSQALQFKLKKDMNLEEVEALIKDSHPWLEYVPNTKADTVQYLHPVHFSGTLNVGVGRLRALSYGKKHFSLFTIGDQLLWGAAEPLRRVLNIILEESN